MLPTTITNHLARIATAAASLTGAALLLGILTANVNARPAACPPGRIVFSRFSNTGPDLYSIDACGNHLRRLTFHGGHFADISPDGERLAFTSVPPGGSTSDIFVMKLDGTGLRDLTNTPNRNDVSPAWSPNGKQIAWSSAPNGAHAGQIFTIDVQTGLQHPVNRPLPGQEADDPRWSPDGRRLVFDTFPKPPNPAHLWVIRASGGDPHAITPDSLDAFGPDWGPNNLIAFASGASAPQSHIWVMRPDGSGEHQLTLDADGGNSQLPTFSPDGNRLTYTHTLTSGASQIWKMTTAGNDQTPLTTGPSDEYSDWGPAKPSAPRSAPPPSRQHAPGL